MRRKAVDMIQPVKREPAQNFWKGFGFALEITEHKDLFAQYPEAEDAALLLEAECLVMSSTPPPVN